MIRSAANTLETRRAFLAQSTAIGLGLLGGTVAGGQEPVATSGRIRIGQIGTTHGHAAGKLAALLSLDALYEVVGVVEPSAERRRALSGQQPYAGLPWLTEDELFATPGLRAVAVETEVADLVPTARRCVAAGVHVHVDKPAGESLPELRDLWAAARQRQLTVQMGYMFRYNPGFEVLRTAVAQGWLGSVFEVHAVMSKQLSRAERAPLVRYRGGAMFDLGSHLIDQVVRLLGMPTRVTPYPRATHPEWDTLLDNQLAVLEYPTATATIRAAYVEVDGGRRRQFVVCGTEGTCEIYPLEKPRVALTLSRAAGPYRAGRHEVELRTTTGRYDDEFRDLAAVINGQTVFGWNAAHDLAAHETLLRASGVL